jgi:putative CocE/NonD family hydrolase
MAGSFLRRLVRSRKTTMSALTAALISALGSTLLPAGQPASPPEYRVELREAWIRMPDGVRLAADLYLPAGEVDGKLFPALLEYLPYRKTESRARCHELYSYFVERGYVVARVDIRGSGNSEGRLIPFEYSDQEHQDGLAVIDWLSGQPWSNGKVGMFGISWGGFNSIQLARLNPPALKAIIAVDATEDLYQEDVHFIDGILHLDSWEMSQDLDNARPGAPDYLIDEAYFRDRFDTQPWMMTSKRQQRDGPFWDRASLKGRYAEIRVPTFLIGGWYDGYRDSLPRMLEKLKAPVKAMIGPWSHVWPHDPYPEPGVEWRHEAVRWFDHWLKGIDTGITNEPRFAVYVRRWHPPGPYLEHAPGFWRWEAGWPVARVEERPVYPQPDHTLSGDAPEQTVHQLRYLPTIGVEAGGPVMWWGDVAHDQRGTDAFSLVYDSAPLTEDTEILGLPRALLQVAADATRANWFVRLSDVAPDGSVTLVTGAGFNGTHRRSAREPEDIEPGQLFPLDIEMHFTSWVFPEGHRIRLSLSNAQWPMFWPTPFPMATSLQLGGETGSRLVLPVVQPGPSAAPAFLPPAASSQFPGFEDLDTGTSSGYGEVSSVDRNPQTGEVTVTAKNAGATRYPWGTETYRETIEHRSSDAHPESTGVHGTHRMEVAVERRVLVWEAELSFSSDRDSFHYRYTRRLEENGKLVREKTWTDTVPRDFQ